MGKYFIKKKEYEITEKEEKEILAERKTLSMYADRLECIENMSDEEAGQFIKAIYSYFKTGVMPELGDRYMDGQLQNMKNGMILLERQYIKKTLTNWINSGSSKSPKPLEASDSHSLPVEATGSNWQPMGAYRDRDSYTYSDRDKYRDREREKERNREPPTIEDIRTYIRDKWNNKKSAEEFISKNPIDKLHELWRNDIDTFMYFGQ
ncbi:MAG: DUF6291 domain-containing protein [Lachnospiraceae bacterium]|nr:DUF6291 domain-containing protein [Lachnospiraceae bacterium]